MDIRAFHTNSMPSARIPCIPQEFHAFHRNFMHPTGIPCIAKQYFVEPATFCGARNNCCGANRHVCGGASIRILPGLPILNCSSTAWYVSRSEPARRMCPSHLNLRTRIWWTRSKLHETLRASCGMVLPEKRASILQGAC